MANKVIHIVYHYRIRLCDIEARWLSAVASVPASAMLPLYCAMHGAIIIAPWCDVSRRWVWVISGQSDGHHSNGHSCAGSLGV